MITIPSKELNINLQYFAQITELKISELEMVIY